MFNNVKCFWKSLLLQRFFLVGGIFRDIFGFAEIIA